MDGTMGCMDHVIDDDVGDGFDLGRFGFMGVQLYKLGERAMAWIQFK